MTMGRSSATTTQPAAGPGQDDLRRYLDVYADSADLGTSLDPPVVAQRLAELVARLGCPGTRAVVNLASEIAEGREPPLRSGAGDLRLRCAALAPAGPHWPDGFVKPDQDLPPVPGTQAVKFYQQGITVTIRGRSSIHAGLADQPDLIESLVPCSPDDPREADASCILTPLVAGRYILGSVQTWHAAGEDISELDVTVQQVLASRAASVLDAARRYARERATVRHLQRSMLARPTALPGVETAARYVAAPDAEGGGDWFDVIKLPGLRVALVAGDVVGRGLEAAATMGRLRTAMQTLTAVDLPPDELLAHLDDLVQQIAAETPQLPRETEGPGGTCCVAIYSAIDQTAAVASAGHPPPAIVPPNGPARYVKVSPGPPLGVGRLAGVPCEVAEIAVEPGSVLALYTDGLVEDHQMSISEGMEALRLRLGAIGQADVLDAAAVDTMTLMPGTVDDAMLLLARTRGIPGGSTAAWQLPAAPESAGAARDRATTWLTGSGVAEVAVDTLELVISELVTNAIRYGEGDCFDLRLIRDQDRVIVEVADSASTAPHITRAPPDAEGGRGVGIVARLVDRWGARHTTAGKTVWAERSATRPPPAAAFGFDPADL